MRKWVEVGDTWGRCPQKVLSLNSDVRAKEAAEFKVLRCKFLFKLGEKFKQCLVTILVAGSPESNLSGVPVEN